MKYLDEIAESIQENINSVSSLPIDPAGQEFNDGYRQGLKMALFIVDLRRPDKREERNEQGHAPGD